MSTQVILLERIEKLGQMGEVVSVKPGYARNYLLPQKKALRASEQNVAYFESQRKTLEAENNKRKKEAETVAKKLDGLKVSLIRQASEGGQLYGSVNARDIAEQIADTSQEKIDRTMVNLNQNFKLIGLFPVPVTLHPEVKVEVVINIARSPEEAEMQLESGQALIAGDAAKDPAAAEAAPDEAALEGVLEDSALEAEKEKQAVAEQEAQDKAEAAAQKAEEQAAAEEAQAEALDGEESPAEDDKA